MISLLKITVFTISVSDFVCVCANSDAFGCSQVTVFLDSCCSVYFQFPSFFTAGTFKKGGPTTAQVCFVCQSTSFRLLAWAMYFPDIIVWCTQNVHQGDSSFTWHLPCNNQTALKVHHLGGHSKMQCVGLQSLWIQCCIQQKHNGSAQKQRIALYSYHCEALKVHPKVDTQVMYM